MVGSMLRMKKSKSYLRWNGRAGRAALSRPPGGRYPLQGLRLVGQAEGGVEQAQLQDCRLEAEQGAARRHDDGVTFPEKKGRLKK